LAFALYETYKNSTPWGSVMIDFIDHILGEQGKAIAHMVEDFARAEITPERSRKMERNHRIDADLIRMIGEQGIIGVQIPKKYGGSSESDQYGNRTFGVAIQEALAYHDPSVALFVEVSGGLAGNSILCAGNETQKETYLPKIVTAELVSAFALSEPNSGSDAGAAQARVTRVDDQLRLNGTKAWITNGSFADFAIWYAISSMDEAGKTRLSAYIVKRDEAERNGYSVRVEDNIGVKASGTSQLIATNISLPQDSLLDGPYKDGKNYEHNGLSLALRVLDDGRLHIAADALGMMKRCIDECVRYAHERKTFGQPLAHRQLIQVSIANMCINYEAARKLVYCTAWEADQNGLMNSVKASMAKTFATERMQEVVKEAIQLHGGIGFSEEGPLAKLSRDSVPYSIFEGTNGINRLVIGGAKLGVNAIR